MPLEDGQNRIEEIKKRIYSNDEHLMPRKKVWGFKQKKFTVPDSWKETAARAKPIVTFRAPTSLFKKFFVGSLVFLGLGVLYAVFMLYAGSNTVSTERVKVVITGNAFVAGGEELPLDVSITNENGVSIDSADLVVEYPRGSEESAAGDYERKRVALDSISPGEEVNEHFNLILYGEQGVQKIIKARIEYRVRGSNAIFTKEATYAVQINTAPVALVIDAQTTSVSNQDYQLKIKAVVGSQFVPDSTVLRVDYPPGFQFVSASPSPTLSNNVFAIEKKSIGSENTITIQGKIIGVDGDKKAFRIAVGEADSKDGAKVAVVYNSLAHEVSLERPFIDAKLTLGGEDTQTYTIPNAEKVETKIAWSNNLATRVDDLEIRAKLYGNALNTTSITGSGFYDSNTTTMVWDKNSFGSFATVEPGEHGTLTLRFSSLPLLSSSTTVIPDPTITVEISVKARQPQEGVAVKTVDSFEKKTFKVATELQLAGVALYGSGPFTNIGPIPPKAGAETRYTIQWKLTNLSNRASQAVVRATLPVNVSFVKIDSSSAEDVTYNETTREVVWRAGNVARGVGFVVPARTASFQIALLPSTSQIGSVPLLLNDANLTAQDLFTATNISKTAARITTRLSNEASFPPGGERVAP